MRVDRKNFRKKAVNEILHLQILGSSDTRQINQTILELLKGDNLFVTNELINIWKKKGEKKKLHKITLLGILFK